MAGEQKRDILLPQYLQVRHLRSTPSQGLMAQEIEKDLGHDQRLWGGALICRPWPRAEERPVRGVSDSGAVVMSRGEEPGAEVMVPCAYLQG